jgi:hypothetical protein
LVRDAGISICKEAKRQLAQNIPVAKPLALDLEGLFLISDV